MELVTARRRCCGAMTAGATGGLEYSLRWGCVANTAYNKTKGAARLGPVCLVTAQTFPGVAAPFVDRNGIPLSAPGLWPGVRAGQKTVLSSTAVWRLLIGQAEHDIYLEGRVMIYVAAANEH